MQEAANKQKRIADEMDINLEVFNLETNFFGDLHCSSRFTDMLCGAQAQYGDYSELDMCPMWGIWVKEGGKLDKGPTENRRDGEKNWVFEKNAKWVIDVKM